MVEVHLTNGGTALIDEEDMEKVSRLNWRSDLRSPSPHAVTTVNDSEKRRRALYLHHFVLGIPSSTMIDHKDRNGLNCQKNNLRKATKSQNGMNRGKQANNKSGFKGVSFDPRRSIWRACIRVDGKQKHLGYFPDKKAAAIRYDEVAAKEFGAFAVLNFPAEKETEAA